MDCTELMTTQVSPAALQAYQYKIACSRRELEKLWQTLDVRKAAADASRECRNKLSWHSGSLANNGEGHRGRARSRLADIPEGERENLIQNLDMSFMSIDTRGNIIPKTPEPGYLAAQTFILASKPQPGDPRASLYQMAMTGVGVMGAALAGREIAPQPESAPRRNSPRQNSPR
jgi:hypothetical protein